VQYDPATQASHWLASVKFVASEYVPFGQNVGSDDISAQYDPMLHPAGYTVFPAQYDPAGHVKQLDICTLG
jgi:hypothetical protein